MNLSGKTVGIWGMGVVGTSAAAFLADKATRIIVYDDKDPLSNTPYLKAPSLPALFDTADAILASPGIDTRTYRSVFQGEWLCELDLFAYYFKKPVAAITGSVGKTTVTHMLTELLQSQGVRAVAGGNIGAPMLSLISEQESLDIAILELSSFQLEYSFIFSPTIAILTNIHPNHLDRHGSMEHYLAAKYNLIAHQHSKQHALIPYALKQQILSRNPASTIAYVSPECIAGNSEDLIFCHDNASGEFHQHGTRRHINANLFPSTTYMINLLTIWSTATLLNIDCTTIPQLRGLEHRLEKVGTIKGITFINDSKSTTPTSTLSAVEQFAGKKILLMIGGLSKGIDRSAMIQQLATKNIHTVCFGKEAELLAHMCRTYNLETAAYQTLHEAFSAVLTHTEYDYVLFSPSGSSYDLFKDYIERGNTFKSLVLSHIP